MVFGGEMIEVVGEVVGEGVNIESVIVAGAAHRGDGVGLNGFILCLALLLLVVVR